jgi:hypothetical protein
MSIPIEIEVIASTDCGLDATCTIPASGGLLIREAKGKDSANGNWTGISLTLTNLDTGAIRSSRNQNDSEHVLLPTVVLEGGRYRLQAVQSNFRETCDFTTVRGRVLENSFLD